MTNKKHYRPKLDPKRDLAGATPETLVCALFRRAKQPTPGPGGKTVAGEQPAVREPAPDQPQDNDAHLVNPVGTA